MGSSILFNYMEQSADESMHAIARLAELAAPQVLVSIRDLDTVGISTLIRASLISVSASPLRRYRRLVPSL